MSEDMEFAVNKFKSLDPQLVEEAIAEAIGKVIDKDCEASVPKVDLREHGFIGSHSMWLSIRVSYDWGQPERILGGPD